MIAKKKFNHFQNLKKNNLEFFKNNSKKYLKNQEVSVEKNLNKGNNLKKNSNLKLDLSQINERIKLNEIYKENMSNISSLKVINLKNEKGLKIIRGKQIKDQNSIIEFAKNFGSMNIKRIAEKNEKIFRELLKKKQKEKNDENPFEWATNFGSHSNQAKALLNKLYTKKLKPPLITNLESNFFNSSILQTKQTNSVKNFHMENLRNINNLIKNDSKKKNNENNNSKKFLETLESKINEKDYSKYVELFKNDEIIDIELNAPFRKKKIQVELCFNNFKDLQEIKNSKNLHFPSIKKKSFGRVGQYILGKLDD